MLRKRPPTARSPRRDRTARQQANGAQPSPVLARVPEGKCAGAARPRGSRREGPGAVGRGSTVDREPVPKPTRRALTSRPSEHILSLVWDRPDVSNPALDGFELAFIRSPVTASTTKGHLEEWSQRWGAPPHRSS